MFFGSKIFKWSNLIFFEPVLIRNRQNLMKFLIFISLQSCSHSFLWWNNFGVNGYLFFYFCLKKKYKIIFIKIYVSNILQHALNFQRVDFRRKSVKFSISDQKLYLHRNYYQYQPSTQCVGGDIDENFRKLVDGQSTLKSIWAKSRKCFPRTSKMSAHVSQKFLSWRKDKEHYP